MGGTLRPDDPPKALGPWTNLLNGTNCALNDTNCALNGNISLLNRTIFLINDIFFKVDFNKCFAFH